MSYAVGRNRAGQRGRAWVRGRAARAGPLPAVCLPEHARLEEVLRLRRVAGGAADGVQRPPVKPITSGEGGVITLSDVRNFREHKVVKEGTLPLPQRERLLQQVLQAHRQPMPG